MDVKGKTVVVTGGGYGIGKQIALAFGRQGASVVVAARSLEKLEAVAAEIRAGAPGRRALALATDVTRESDVTALFDRVARDFGRIDVLVNNSGIGGPTALARDVGADEWRQTIDVNLTGAFLCAKHASRSMIEAGRGVIINIASVAGRIGFPNRSPYAASKWGLIGLSHSLAAELGPFGIRVNAVLPGAVQGDRLRTVIENRARAEHTTADESLRKVIASTPLGRLIDENEVADVVTFLASDAASGITGQAVNVCGGLRMQ